MKSEIKIGALLSYVIIGLNTLVGLFYTPFLTSMLGQSEFGLYSLISSIISYLTVLDFGFGNAITVYTSKYLATKNEDGMSKLNGMFLTIYSLIGVIVAIVGVLIAINMNSIFGQTMNAEELDTAKILTFILTFNLVITFPFSIFSNIITAYEKFIFSKCVNIFRVVSQPIFMTPLLIFGYKSIMLVTIITLINLICITINTVYAIKKINVKFSFKNFDKKLLIEICSYSIFIFLNQIIDKINWGVDNFILGAICGTNAVAIYSVALQFNTMYLSFSTAISGVLLPKVSKMEAKKASDEEFTNIFIKTGRIQFIILGIIITGFILFGKQFIIYLFGYDYEDAYIIGCILMLPVTIPLIQNVGISILQAKNKFQFYTLIIFIIAIINIVISIWLSKLAGGVGAAIGTGLSFLVGKFLIMNFYYQIKVNINVVKFWKHILLLSIPYVLLFVSFMCIINIVSIANVFMFVMLIVIYSSLYALITWFFVLNHYEKQTIIKFFKKH